MMGNYNTLREIFKLCLLLNLFCAICTAVKETDVRNYLGTRTPYRFRSNNNDSQITFPNCKDKKVWMVIRHGTRLPKAKDIISMATMLRDLKLEILLAHKMGRDGNDLSQYKTKLSITHHHYHNSLWQSTAGPWPLLKWEDLPIITALRRPVGNLTKEQIEMLGEWSSKLDPEEAMNLAQEGQDEMVLLAERMMKRFPNAIQKTYCDDTFHFKYTPTERAQQSARYFTIGLFDKKNSDDVIFAPAARVDPVLRFYKHCDKWLLLVKNNPETYNETARFGVGPQMNETLEIVSKRLGLTRTLNIAEVNLIYKVCGYETAWSKYYKSPWCEMLDVDNAKALEYLHDLKAYWKDGYAHNLTYKQACLSIKNMFENFSTENSPNATFLFAHSGTILKILAHLQLYKPANPLLGDRIHYDSVWKTSVIDCFASNLAFVLYKCQNEDYVLTLHQEKVIKLPMCDTELCSLNKLKEQFYESIYHCDYTDMCSLN